MFSFGKNKKIRVTSENMHLFLWRYDKYESLIKLAKWDCFVAGYIFGRIRGLLRLEFGHFAEGNDIIKVYKLVFGDCDGMKMCDFVSKIRIYKEALFGGNFESYPMSSPTYNTFDFDRGFELSTKALLSMTNLEDCHSIPEYEDAEKYTLETNLAGHILDPLETGGYFHVMIVSFFEKKWFHEHVEKQIELFRI